MTPEFDTPAPERVSSADPIFQRFKGFQETFRSNLPGAKTGGGGVQIQAGIVCTLFGLLLLVLGVIMILAGAVSLVLSPFKRAAPPQ